MSRMIGILFLFRILVHLIAEFSEIAQIRGMTTNHLIMGLVDLENQSSMIPSKANTTQLVCIC